MFGSITVSFVGVPLSEPSIRRPFAPFLTFLMYSPSRIPEPPLKPYGLGLTPFPFASPLTPKVWKEEKDVEVAGGEDVQVLVDGEDASELANTEGLEAEPARGLGEL